MAGSVISGNSIPQDLEVTATIFNEHRLRREQPFTNGTGIEGELCFKFVILLGGYCGFI